MNPDDHKFYFFFDFASPYSYLSFFRIKKFFIHNFQEENICLCPFLLGVVFKNNGWNTSPFNIFPAKGEYMWKDVKRQATKYNLPFQRPVEFPAYSLHATRVFYALSSSPLQWKYVQAVFQYEFQDSKDTKEKRILKEILERELLLPNADEILEHSTSDSVKELVRSQTELAIQNKIFGAPSFLYQNELFWGDDRLEDAIGFYLAQKKEIRNI
ncbi:2-hydroxychromene-2-carboxylate isomerase [Leptospira sp. 96542]|nr:2-hydroxychromene-2-carboxylate isomerase [Leptospira sp. 96542]